VHDICLGFFKDNLWQLDYFAIEVTNAHFEITIIFDPIHENEEKDDNLEHLKDEDITGLVAHLVH
jgi:hypothetical protein